MDKIQKNIRRVFWLYFVLFTALALYLGKLIFFDGASLTASVLNPRLQIENKTLLRGDILDADGQVLAESQRAPDGTITRHYPLGSDGAHLVGFADYQKAGLLGVESAYNAVLQTARNELWQRLLRFFNDSEVKGSSLVLTVSGDLQQYAAQQLGQQKGAILILEPSTGKILAMVSYPAFDPNHVRENWDALKSDEGGSPLLNRASQGKYPPGSVFKIITAAAALEHVPDVGAFRYTCTGVETFDGSDLTCFNSIVHGDEEISKAFSVSCNTFFATMGIQIGAENLRNVAERFYFNTSIPFPLEYSVSSFPLSHSSSETEIAETAIGQGRIMATPLQMTLITAAVANEGVMMAPYVVDHVLDYNSRTVSKTMPAMMDAVFTVEEADRLTAMMEEVMKTGTGKNAAVSGVSIAAKTGTAQTTPNEEDHGWFVAFTPVENPQYALCVVLENGGGASRTLPIAKNIISYLQSPEKNK